MNRTIMITGASSGFGSEIARKFAAARYSLVLLARRVDRLDNLKEELSELTSVHIIAADLRVRGEVESAVGNLPPEFSTIDILVNNAGLALGLEPAHETNLDQWEQMVDTNIKGLMYCTRAVLPKMVMRNSGLIINIGSTAGRWPYPGGNVYGGTKAFVEQFSRNLRADLFGKRVRVTCIAPGMAETEFSEVRFGGDHKKASKVYEKTSPLTASDIADTALWLAGLPEHVNVNFMEIMPTDQTWGNFAVYRNR